MSGADPALRLGHGPWRLGEGVPPWSKPRDSFATGTIIIGAGITGSMLAQHLTALGRPVALVDRISPGQGSTAASTAMLQWEIDRSLSDLVAFYGFERAARIYQLSLNAVRGLGQLVKALGIACDWRDRAALYLADAAADGGALVDEAAIRATAGLPTQRLGAGRLRDDFGIQRPDALISTDSAECDPVRLSHALLHDAVQRGARLIEDEVTAYDFGTRQVHVGLASGREIEAESLVLATGYAMPPFVKAPIHKLSASWAAVTAAGTALPFWRDRVLLWEDATPYLYARTTADDRILVGGEDEPVDDPKARDALAPGKAAAMHRKLAAIWGVDLPPFQTVWSATFGETEDGLPLIGPVPDCPNAYAAYGYGGNGITFSYLASRMLGGALTGRGESWFDLFALDRPPP